MMHTLSAGQLGIKPRASYGAHGTTSNFLGSQVAFRLPAGFCRRAAVLQARQRRSIVVEANLFSRISRLVRSTVTQIVTSAEDPEKILEQAVEDMQNDLVKMRQASAQVLASQKQIERKYEQAQQTADEWYKRAQLALEKGEEDLAREALKRKKGFQDQADAFKLQLEQQRKAVETLISNTRTMEAKLAEAKTKKDTLKARAASAKTSRELNEMLGATGTGKTAYEAFEKMEEKVVALESETEAAFQLAAPNDSVESAFKALEGSSVDTELAKMKKELNIGRKPVAELPAGRPIRDAIDIELEELRRKTRD